MGGRDARRRQLGRDLSHFAGPQPHAAAVDGAEDFADPLGGLAEKVAADPGAPFAPEVLRSLCELKGAFDPAER